MAKEKKKVDEITEAYHEIMDIYAKETETQIEQFISALIPFVLTIIGILEYKKKGKKISNKHREGMKMAKEMLVEALSGAILSGSTINMFALPLKIKNVWAERISYDPSSYVHMRSTGKKKHEKKNTHKKGKTK